MDEVSIGLVLNFVGASILVFVSLFGSWYQVKPANNWKKRYWWMGWRPFYKNTKTMKWNFRLNHKVIVEGFIPPEKLWNSVGFLFVVVGFYLQLKFI